MPLMIYVLELQNKKYYVGKTTNLKRRLEQHKAMSNESSVFVKQHGPYIKVAQLYENCDAFDEDKYTKIWMQKQGMDNVRGGSYSQLDLSAAQRQLIETEFKNNLDKCFHCGQSGHFVKYCPSKFEKKNKSSKDNSKDGGKDVEKDDDKEDEKDDASWIIINQKESSESADCQSLTPQESTVSLFERLQDLCFHL